MMEISYLLKRSAGRFKNRICVVFGEKRLTFQEVNERANNLANGLLCLGLQVGERVCILMNNSHRYIEVYCALPKAGLTRVPLNDRDSWEEHAFKIENCQASTLIFGEEFMGFAADFAFKLPSVKHLICVRNRICPDLPDYILDYEAVIQSATSEEPEVEVPGNTLYRMTHTGGTTGRSKPVMMTHRAESELLTNMLLNVMPFKKDDVFVHVHPLSHGTACLMLPAIVRGATQVISNSAEPEHILNIIEKERVTSTWLVPATLIRLISYRNIRQYDLSSLRRILYGGAPMPLARLKDALKIFGPVMGQIYGQAEIPFCASFLAPEDHVAEG